MSMSRKEFMKTAGKGLIAAGAAAAAPALAKNKRKSSPGSGGFKMEIKTRRLDLRHAWTIARNTSTFKEYAFVRLEKDGISGMGEAAHNVRYGESLESILATLEKARPILEHADPWQFVDLNAAVQAVCAGQTAAKAAIDIALMDWIGKSLEIPLYQLWGLDPKKAPQTTFSIGIDTMEMVKQKVEEAAPYPLLKIKMGKENDEEILAAVRSVTSKVLRVDANEGWKEKELALRKVEWLAANGVDLVEQPMPSHMLEETAWVKERASIPLIADESVKTSADIPKLAEAFDGINIKVDKAGGLQESLRMIWMARSLGLKIMLGCMVSSSLSITAAAHLSPLTDYPDLDGNLLLAKDPFRGVTVREGWLILPAGPGLGVEGDF
ncbi:MAG TPA: dipeptide epimerase [bacterium]|nr:dipeptide epimerase [bacterium]HPR87002.1 dipeptide epimerase [bacterium]